MPTAAAGVAGAAAALLVLAAALAFPACAEALTRPQDLAALQAFAGRLTDPGALPWHEDADPCDGAYLAHVHCAPDPASDGLDAVVGLYLDDLGLEGSVSPALGNLTLLQDLYLGGNALGGEFPALGSMPTLKKLGLLSNHFSSLGKGLFTGLPNLDYLVLLNNTNLGGGAGFQLPDDFGALSQLTVLDLSNTSLTGPIPALLFGLSSLTNVSLALNSLTGGLPSSFDGAHFPNLVSLRLNNNKLTGLIPSSLATISGLYELFLHGNVLTGPIPPALGQLVSLQSLMLEYNNLVGPVPGFMSRFNAAYYLTGNGFCSLVGQSCAAETMALLAFASAVNYDTQLSSWVGNKPCGTVWKYVGCNSAGHVTRLSPSHLDLQGTLSPSLASLSYLMYLDVSNNRLAGSVSPLFTLLPELLVFNVANNNLTGVFPLFNATRVAVTNGGNRFILPPSSQPSAPPITPPSLAPVVPSLPSAPPSPGTPSSPPSPSTTPNNAPGTPPAPGAGPPGPSAPPAPGTPSPTPGSGSPSSGSPSGPSPPGVPSSPAPPPLTSPSGSGGASPLPGPASPPPVAQAPVPTPAPSPAASPDPGQGVGGRSSASSSILVAAIVVPSIVVALALVVFCVILLCKRRRRNNGLRRVSSPSNLAGLNSKGGSASISSRSLIGTSALALAPLSGSLTKFSITTQDDNAVSSPVNSEYGDMSIKLEVIQAATNNFADQNIVGRGGFGTVYYGLLHDGTKVAVKRMEAGALSQKALKEYAAEISVLGKLRHRHLVGLLGFCVDGFERLIVYEFMTQGPLSRHLFEYRRWNLQPLDWRTRISIALDVARGIDYLHSLAYKSFIHRDLKPSNILLDDSFRAKVSDFGLVKLAPEGLHSIETRIAGTFGYLAPEYAEESMHLASWFMPIIQDRAAVLQVLDPSLNVGREALESMYQIAELAGHCCARDPRQRPQMSDAVALLTPHVQQWKPQDPLEDATGGIDTGISLAQALQQWQDMAEGDELPAAYGGFGS
eukprot:SM000019S04956  [mRNA]  locus=s19:246325:252045:+ [translate_table: standard]